MEHRNVVRFHVIAVAAVAATAVVVVWKHFVEVYVKIEFKI